ncbi:MAG: hypothetical protein RhofKO_11480 [Rhodothermales bacterium]
MKTLLVALCLGLLVADVNAQTPVVHLPFDEGTECTTREATASSSLQLEPCTDFAWTTGRQGSGLTWTGASGRVNPDHSSLDNIDAITLSAWIQHAPTTTWRALIDKRDSNTDGFDLYIASDSRLYLRINGFTLKSHQRVADGTWHHVVGTYDGERLRLYIDGVLDRHGEVVGPATMATTAELTIGHHFSNTSSTFEGTMDEVRVYAEALGEMEVLNLYNITPAVQEEQALGAWSLDEGAGCSVGEAAYAGTLGANCPAEAPAWTAGVSQTGLHFTEAAHEVRVPLAPAMLNQLTLSAWIQSEAAGGWRAIIEHRDSGGDGYNLFLNPSGQAFMRVNQSTVAGQSNLNDGAWHHVAGVYNGSQLRLYVDGQLEATQSIPTTTTSVQADLLIGHHHASSSYTFAGRLDEVGAYRVALSEAAITALYEAHVDDPTTANRIGYWPLDTTEACTTPDEAGRSDGALLNGCPDDGPQAIPGIAGQALTFGHRADAVEVAASAELNTLEAVTMAAWVKAPTADEYRAIIDKRDANADGFDLFIDRDSKLFVRINNRVAASNAVVADSQWHHVAGVYDGETIRLYVDGELDTAVAADAGPLDTTAPLYIGHHFERDVYTFIGAIDEVMVFDDALSDAAIAALIPAGPDMEVTLARTSPEPLVVEETTTLVASIRQVLPGAPSMSSFTAQLSADPAMGIESVAVVACPGGACVYQEATQQLSYTGALHTNEAIELAVTVRGAQEAIGAAVSLQLAGVSPAESATASLPNLNTIQLNVAVPGSGIVYYVDAEQGSDANTGAMSLPFATLQHCVDQWDGAQQYTCRGRGVFNEEIVITHGGPSPERKNRILAWDATEGQEERADGSFVLDGETTRDVAIANALNTNPSNVEIGYLNIKNYEPDGGCLSNGPVHFVNLRCSLSSGCADWNVHHNVMENLGRTCNVGSVGSQYIAIRPTNAPRFVLDDNVIEGVGGFIMRYSNGDHMVVRDNEIHVDVAGIKAWGNTQDSLYVIGNDFICDGSGLNSVSRPGECSSSNALNFANNIQHGLIQGNSFTNCFSAIKIGTDSRAGRRTNGHHVIENNIISQDETVCSNYNSPFQIDDDSDVADRDGVELYVHDVVIRNNVIQYTGTNPYYPQGAGLLVQSGHAFEYDNNIRIYNNTIRGFRWGIAGIVANLKSLSGPAPYQANGFDIRNNLFERIHEAQITFADYHTKGLALPDGWTFDHNVYGADTYFAFDGAERSPAEWQALGYDAQGRWCSPVLVSTTDPHLDASDTCAAGAGVPLAEVPFDFDGEPRSPIAPDAGADESEQAAKRSADNTLVPSEFALLAPYPNPMRDQATVAFSLPEASHVTLTVVDILGRPVLTLVDGERASGVHRTRISSAMLASGMYFLHVRANGERKVRTLQVIR